MLASVPALEDHPAARPAPARARVAPGRIGILQLLALTLAFGMGAGCTPETASTPELRVVLITLDTLRHDRFAGGTDTPSRMPRLLARAAKGVRFSRFYAASPLTQPTHATLLTALHPWQHRITRNGQVLDPEAVTLAERLGDAGFETRAVVASFPVASRFGFAQGFDAFDEDFSEDLFGRDRWEGEWDVPDREFFALGEAVTDRALASLDAARASRQFFWFHYFDPHSPYGSSTGARLDKRQILRRVVRGGEPEADVLREARALYDADVDYLDRALERLLERLEADSAHVETHLFVTSDHGESFGEGGSLGHGTRLSPEQLHVPAFLVSPVVEPGERSDVAGSIDVMPTLLALAGVPVAGAGRDLLLPPDAATRAYGMRRTFRDPEAAMERRLDGREHPLPPLWFFVTDPQGHIRTGNGRELGPAHNGVGVAGAGADEIRALFARFETELGDTTGGDVLDPEVERALRALGYVQ
jgi:arylsulfatase A-like enzyme